MPVRSVGTVARKRTFIGSVAATLGLIMVSVAVAAWPATTARTIGDANGDNLLDATPGEPYVVRTELGTANAGRATRRTSRLFFAQLTDAHIIDEESPLRVEFIDPLIPALESAHRPQEGLSPHVLNEMVRQVRDSRSPVSDRAVQLVMTTGDNSDNGQRNEVRWFIDLLDGGKQINPNSGVPGTCGTIADGHLYDGVRGAPYYEPDHSSAPGHGSVDGAGYAPTEAENLAEVGRRVAMRDFPGLYEQMNKPFRATGLGVPWYGIFGNHDGLVLGTVPRNEGLEALATGCVKITQLSAATLRAIQPLLVQGLTAEEHEQAVQMISADLLASAADPALAPWAYNVVPKDPNRVPLRKVQYIGEHWNTGGLPVGHGFTAENLRTGQGNYAFAPRPGLRFIVLDSINERGLSDGNIDDTQFRWLHQQLRAAGAREELVMVFAHHSLRTMNQRPVTIFKLGDGGGNTSPLVHFGLGPRDTTSPCTITDPDAAPVLGETLRCLFLRHRSVIAFITGHEHRNRVTPYARSAGDVPDGGFWEITTASHIDWPQQSRLIDLLDNGDGTLSIFGTMLDHTSLLQATVPGGETITGDGVRRLASIGRELSFNDPQGKNGEDGTADRRGTPADRNVELLLRHPFQ
jgi:metallophosphoesterase (TIGR03767 family)